MLFINNLLAHPSSIYHIVRINPNFHDEIRTKVTDCPALCGKNFEILRKTSKSLRY